MYDSPMQSNAKNSFSANLLSPLRRQRSRLRYPFLQETTAQEFGSSAS
jgi:hypothetical protein